MSQKHSFSWLAYLLKGNFNQDEKGVITSLKSMLIIREIKHARFWDTDGNRKRTFRVLGPYCLLDFDTTHL